MYYTVVKHDGHSRTRGKMKKTQAAGKCFYISLVFSMFGVFYDSVIHGLAFFICFMPDVEICSEKQ